jgi:hypothetical protein
MNQLDKESFPAVGSNEYNIQKVFASLLFDIINIPSFEELEKLDKAVQDNHVKIAYHPETCEFAIGIQEDEFEPMLIINTNLILYLMKKNHPLRPIAEEFEGREYDNIITLDEAIELNKNGRIIVTPISGDRIHIYGIGTLADKLSDQTIEFGIGGFSSEEETVLYYVPSHQDKFISTDDFEDMLAVLGSLQGGKIEAYPVIAHKDPNQGFIVKVKGMDTYSFTIHEEGNIYGRGLVMEI